MFHPTLTMFPDEASKQEITIISRPADIISSMYPGEKQSGNLTLIVQR
jgi:hypothetical protein